MRLKWFFILIFISALAFSQESNKSTRPKVGVVLSGGGAKGYAHIGALKIIENAGVKIDYIGGTSMGAIVGGLYASGYTPEQLEEIIHQLDLSSLILEEKSRAELPLFDKVYKEKYILELPFNNFKLSIPNAISSGQGPIEALTYLLRHVHDVEDFNQLPTPFLCIATDVESGEEKIFRSGYLPQVVMASGAYPSLLDPVRIDGELYIDGGVKNNFPVQEVIDMGADIIIGVDLETGLTKKEDINSAIKIIEQIVSYGIVEKTSEQRKLVDVLIRPDMKNYSVTSFEEKDSIIQKGVEASLLVHEQLKEIAKKQGFQNIEREEIKIDEHVLIKEIKTSGLETLTESYIKGKLKIKPPELVNYDDISAGIHSLYSSGNFSKIYYKVLPADENYMLSLHLKENPTRQSIRFGLHYDDLYKTGILINFTAKHLLFDNSTLSTDFILGDYLRYNVNYFIDNGYLPSFGINSSFRQFKEEINLKNFINDENIGYLGKLDYDFYEFINQFYVQSTLAEKFAVGLGAEHQFIKIKTENLSRAASFSTIDNSYYMNLFAYLRADNRDNSNFPSRGIEFSGSLKYLLDSNADDFESMYQLKAKVEMNFPIIKWISLRVSSSFGTYFGDTPAHSQNFILGGYTEQSFLNHIKFYGLPFGYTGGSNHFTLGSSLQLKILKNHYVNTFLNVGNVENDFKDLDFLNFEYTGYGISYGYDSPLGPLSVYWTYSPDYSRGMFNVSLGYWF